MSPCEVVPPPPKQNHLPTNIDHLLRSFDISTNGFLPESPPLQHLSNPYYAPWEFLITTLPADLQSGTFRTKVASLPILSTTHLTDLPSLRRAYVLLTFFAHAHIWAGPLPSPVLPPQITLPLLSVSTALSLPPIATYASLNLYNYATSTPHLLDTITTLHTFSATPSESWFYAVSIAIEANGAPLIRTLLSALYAARRHHVPVVTACLHDFAHGIHDLGVLLDRMDERCDPTVFYHVIRPFLAGTKNMEAAGLPPTGVFYDTGNDSQAKGEWKRLRGGSNGQSSLIQFFDVALGVKHVGAGGFHDEVRGYMPPRHRAFLEWVGETFPGGLRGLVLTRGGGRGRNGEDVDMDVECAEAFGGATRALAEFRGRHLRMVTRYIVIPSRMGLEGKGEGVRNLATWTGSRSELTGTGGTALLPFLKETRDETLRAGEV